MADLTVLQIIDNAVKIGLGGIIAVIGTVTVTNRKNKHEESVERNKRIDEILESVALNIVEVTHS
ncbi:hypothetical protein ACROAE_09225 [Shewanella sp. MF05960]|uniref:hypothetical protein n=1 Tax=Shewanella sp. MF05960 TaxID=3434874 RepID=UPI003D78FF88